MVRRHLIAAAVLLAAGPAYAQEAAPADATAAPAARAARPPSAARMATAPGADPARDAMPPRRMHGKGKMARSARSRMMDQTTHDIMMPQPDAKPDAVAAPPQ